MLSDRSEDQKTGVDLNPVRVKKMPRSGAFMAPPTHTGARLGAEASFDTELRTKCKASATRNEILVNMKIQKLQHFQTDGETWEKRAEKGKLPAVIDPGDLKGRKNLYIDILQKIAIQKALGQGKKEIIIDFGCGSGRFSDLLSHCCRFLVGVEITPEMLKIAKNEYKNSNIGSILYDGLNLPMKENEADLLVSVNVLQYITDEGELGKVLKEIKRCLKPDGEFICIEQVTKNKKRWQRDFKTYLNLFRQNDFKKIADYPIRKGHFLWLYPIYFGLVPKSFLKAVAKLEMFLRRIFWHSIWDYQDHLFRMKKI